MCLSATLRSFPDDKDDNFFAYLIDAYFKIISFPKIVMFFDYVPSSVEDEIKI